MSRRALIALTAIAPIGACVVAFHAPVLGDDQAAEFQFVDEWQHEGVDLCGKRLLIFSSRKPAELQEEPEYASPEPLYATVKLGEGRANTFTLVLDAPTDAAEKAIWIDANADSVVETGDRHAVGPLSSESDGAMGVETELVIPIETADANAATRLVRVRLGSIGRTALVSIRGYCRGTLRLAGEEYAAALSDANANGLFSDWKADRLYVDVNGDGKFALVGEAFALGETMRIGQRSYSVAVSPLGDRLSMHERGTGEGKLTLSLAGGTPKVDSLHITLVRDDRVVVPVQAIGEPVTIPEGTYTVSAMSATLKAEDGKKWSYSWQPHSYSPAEEDEGLKKRRIEVAAGKQTAADALGNLLIRMQPLGDEAAKPGESIRVSVKLFSETGLDLTDCRVGGSDPYARQQGAHVALRTKSGTQVARAPMGFG